MKRYCKILALLLIVAFVLSAFIACDVFGEEGDEYVLDIYSINDLHGKFVDGDSQPGVDEMTTYLRQAKFRENVVLLSAGDMWQGGVEAGLTKGAIMTDWMNDLGFDAMTLGNHEFDWGTEYIEDNADIAQFPILAINVYDVETDERLPYCQPSLLIDKGQVQIGVIGAIGDCYSSISGDKVEEVYFKTDYELTALVKAESQSLKSRGADFIIYVIHDGYGRSSSAIKSVSGNEYRNDGGVYYDTSLSDGYVDIVFEGHSHANYVLKDEYGVYHLQGGGDNSKGISHAKVVFNLDSGKAEVSADGLGLIEHIKYKRMSPDSIVDTLVEKYNSVLGSAYETLGRAGSYYDSSELRNLVAELYYARGVEEWGDEYNIVLGGGYLSVRSPYNLGIGNVTYADLYMLLPFDNDIVLCSIKGSDLKRRYLQNGDYYIYLGAYGNSIRDSINDNATYYIITDTYNSTYSANRLTTVATLSGVYARDVVADYIAEGNMA